MLTGGIIKIYVGPKRKEYQVHRGLLALNEYWRTYLASKLAEDSEIVHLPQQRAKTWDLFVNWLYRGSLKDICVENEDAAKKQAIQYIVLYTSAEKWAMPALQNKIMDKLHAWTPSIWHWFDDDVTRHAYKATPRDSPLRSYLVDCFLKDSSLLEADCERGTLLKLQLDYGNQEFVLECFEALMQLTPKSKLRAPNKKIACTYHKHEDEKRCSK